MWWLPTRRTSPRRRPNRCRYRRPNCSRSPGRWRRADRDALFPPALHPVNPPVVTFSFLRARECTHGPFTLAETRLLCRSGIRTRGYHVGAFVDNAEVATILSTGWGYRVAVADVTMSHRYDGATGRVAVDGVVALLAGHVSPRALSPSDLQYTSTMHPARLDRGPPVAAGRARLPVRPRRTRGSVRRTPSTRRRGASRGCGCRIRCRRRPPWPTSPSSPFASSAAPTCGRSTAPSPSAGSTAANRS